MNANRSFVAAILGGAISLVPLLAPAGEPPTFGAVLDTGRHVFENVQVLRITPTHLFFRHSRGITSLPIAELPPEVRVQIEDRIPAGPSARPVRASERSVPPSVPEGKAAPEQNRARPAAPSPGSGPADRVPRTPAVRSRATWIVYPIRTPCPSPLGTGAFPGPRGLPLNWFHVHPSVYPQTLANPEWRALAERDFFLTAARHNPALLTRGIVSGW